MKIEFIKSPTGVFNLAYFSGDVCEMDNERAKLLVEGGFAKVYTPAKEPEPVVVPVVEQVKPEPVVENEVKRGRPKK